MKQRSRSDAIHCLTRPDSTFLKFLKPGALAQLRNSRLTSRSHHRRLTFLPSPPPSPSPPPPSAAAAHSFVINGGGGGGLLPSLSCGPRFPQRKKLVAAKVATFLRPPSPATDSSDPIVGDVVVAAH